MRSQVGFFIMLLRDFSKDESEHLAAALLHMGNAKVFLVSVIHPGLRTDLSLTCYL